jgi:hypothetical protein
MEPSPGRRKVINMSHVKRCATATVQRKRRNTSPGNISNSNNHAADTVPEYTFADEDTF